MHIYAEGGDVYKRQESYDHNILYDSSLGNMKYKVPELTKSVSYTHLEGEIPKVY